MDKRIEYLRWHGDIPAWIMEQAQPCPFCGKCDLYETYDEWDNSLIMCRSCEAIGPSAKDHDEAWHRWNKRDHED